MILVTGGAGFIGSNFVLDWLENHDEHVINLDALTYAGNLANLESLQGDPRHVFQHGDIGDRDAGRRDAAQTHRPRAIVNFAAESHVDRSILGPGAFLKTNIEGTFNLLEAARAYYATLEGDDKASFRFLHVSTDEVYGSLTRRRRAVHRDAPVRAEQPVLGEQGRQRPPGARLAPHLRPAGAHHQLLEQLRPAALPREADPAGDRQRARRQVAAGLRRRPERARLALRQGSLLGDPHRAGRRPRRRDLQRRRREREDQHRDRARHLRACSTSCAPTPPARASA